MSITTSSPLTQPAIVGGVVLGTLSALPIVAIGNCCCLWVIGGGMVAAYLLQQNQATPLTPGDGALVGLLAGVVGSFVYLVLSIPITFLLAPLQQAMMERIMDSSSGIPPEFRQYVGTMVGGTLKVVLEFGFMLVVGSLFSTIGGVIGALVFKKSPPPAPTDLPVPGN